MNLLATRAAFVADGDGVVPSPCISVCRMHATTGLCEGCLRTVDEISGWSVSSDEKKRAIWALIAGRIPAPPTAL